MAWLAQLEARFNKLGSVGSRLFRLSAKQPGHGNAPNEIHRKVHTNQLSVNIVKLAKLHNAATCRWTGNNGASMPKTSHLMLLGIQTNYVTVDPEQVKITPCETYY